jgi:hypothetical protein
MIFLRWQNNEDGSADRFTMSLFSYISPRWYPINVINSEIYSTFEMYGAALSDAQAELDQTYNDLNIDTTRIASTGNRTTPKIYDNFGYQFMVTKLFNQYYDNFATSSVLSSYRQELRVLAQAFLSGGSIEGINDIGYAFTGIAPLVIQPLKADNRWRLTNVTGSVAQVTNEFIVPTHPIPVFGYYIPAQGFNFNPGDNFIVSYSKLGYNTKLRSKEEAYSRLDVTIYSGTASTGSISFINAVTNALNHIIKADQYLHLTFSDKLAYYRPQTGTGSVQITDVFALSTTGYLYNSAPISATGSAFLTDVLQLPGNYQNYDWFMDWMLLTSNDAYAKVEIREYNSSIIPDSVYFKEYNVDPIPLLATPDKGVMGLHWLFCSNAATIYDISGNGFNINMLNSTTNVPTYVPSRSQGRLALISGSGTLYYAKVDNADLQFSSGFYSKMWINGINNNISANAHKLEIKNYSLTSPINGYGFGIDIDNRSMFINISINNVVTTATASIAYLFNETIENPHYFGYTYYLGKAYFYLDNACISSQNINISIPTVSDPSTLSVIVTGSGIGLDEIVWSEGFLTIMQVMSDFSNTKPRYAHSGIPSGSVNEFYQAKLTMFASGSHELEFHQFSMRGATRKYNIGKGANTINPYVVPIFKKN